MVSMPLRTAASKVPTAPGAARTEAPAAPQASTSRERLKSRSPNPMALSTSQNGMALTHQRRRLRPMMGNAARVRRARAPVTSLTERSCALGSSLSFFSRTPPGSSSL